MDMIEGRVSDLEIRMNQLEGKIEELKQSIIGLESQGTSHYADTLSGILDQIEGLQGLVRRLIDRDEALRNPDLGEG